MYSPSMSLLCHDYTRPLTTCFAKCHVSKIGHEHAASFFCLTRHEEILQARAREAATAAITELNPMRLKALMVGTLVEQCWCF